MLKPGPWRRGHNLDLQDGSYVTRSRCKTGYRIRRCCSRCRKWEVWRHNIPMSRFGRFDTWSDARDALLAEHYGRHDRLTLGFDALMCPVWQKNRDPQHLPGEDRWDACWLLWTQRFVAGAVLVTDDDDNKLRWWQSDTFVYRDTLPATFDAATGAWTLSGRGFGLGLE